MLVRIAELEIDPRRRREYVAALREEIEVSVETEPGVIFLLAVSVRDDPKLVRVIEGYADQEAYEAHIRTPHFLKYKAGTAVMVASLKLIETDSIALGGIGDSLTGRALS